jgi:hypothetical protein
MNSTASIGKCRSLSGILNVTQLSEVEGKAADATDGCLMIAELSSITAMVSS